MGDTLESITNRSSEQLIVPPVFNPAVGDAFVLISTEGPQAEVETLTEVVDLSALTPTKINLVKEDANGLLKATIIYNASIDGKETTFEVVLQPSAPEPRWQRMPTFTDETFDNKDFQVTIKVKNDPSDIIFSGITQPSFFSAALLEKNVEKEDIQNFLEKAEIQIYQNEDTDLCVGTNKKVLR